VLCSFSPFDHPSSFAHDTRLAGRRWIPDFRSPSWLLKRNVLRSLSGHPVDRSASGAAHVLPAVVVLRRKREPGRSPGHDRRARRHPHERANAGLVVPCAHVVRGHSGRMSDADRVLISSRVASTTNRSLSGTRLRWS
jgi:hypothetical protein